MKRLASPLTFTQSPLARRERDLDRVEKLIELYEPFILHNEHIFGANNIELLSAAFPRRAERRLAMTHLRSTGGITGSMHIPALRKWSYPIIEGRPLEQRPGRAFLPEHVTGIRV